jgi:hypothetical protein
MLVLTGLIKPIVRNGMLMGGVLGMLVILVQYIMATNPDANDKLVVTTTQLLVQGSMNRAVMGLLVVLGQIIH